MTDAINKFLDGINQTYLNSIEKIEREFNRKLTKYEKEIVAENFVLRLKNQILKKAKNKGKNININQYYLKNEILY